MAYIKMQIHITNNHGIPYSIVYLPLSFSIYIFPDATVCVCDRDTVCSININMISNAVLSALCSVHETAFVSLCCDFVINRSFEALWFSVLGSWCTQIISSLWSLLCQEVTFVQMSLFSQWDVSTQQQSAVLFDVITSSYQHIEMYTVLKIQKL